MKARLHLIRENIANLYYNLFDSLTYDQKGAFIRALENIDNEIKECEDL